MIISNTTPLSNFLHLGQIGLLEQIFKQIYIAEAVKKEIDAFFQNNMSWCDCLNKFVIVKRVKSKAFLKQLLTTLHIGEAETICLCLENDTHLCLMDDKDGRNIAQINSISISGTLGILIHAKNNGLIKSAKEYMDRLKNDHHFWISEHMYSRVLRLTNEQTC
jgi:predicted nucleic acid-binding protein